MSVGFSVTQTDRSLFGVSGNDIQSLKPSPSVQTHSSKSKLKSGISSDNVEECRQVPSGSVGKSAAGSIAILGVVARVSVELDPSTVEGWNPKSTSEV